MVLYLIFSWCQHRRDRERVIISKAKHRVLDLCTFPHQRSKSTHSYKHVFCFAINILTALGAEQHVLCDCYADKIFCEFSPHQCFSFGLSQLGSLPSKMDCFDQSIWWFDGWHGIKSSNAFFQLLCAVAIFNPTVGSLRGSSWRFVLPLSRYEGSFINNPEMQTSIWIVQKQMWANRISTKTHILCHIL